MILSDVDVAADDHSGLRLALGREVREKIFRHGHRFRDSVLNSYDLRRLSLSLRRACARSWRVGYGVARDRREVSGWELAKAEEEIQGSANNRDKEQHTHDLATHGTFALLGSARVLRELLIGRGRRVDAGVHSLPRAAVRLELGRNFLGLHKYFRACSLCAAHIIITIIYI